MGRGENRRVRAGGSSLQDSLSPHPPCSERKKCVLVGSLFSWVRFSGQSSPGSKCPWVVSPDMTLVILGSFGHHGTCFLCGVGASAAPTVNLSDRVGVAG